jgi:hypothetical protein
MRHPDRWLIPVALVVALVAWIDGQHRLLLLGIVAGLLLIVVFIEVRRARQATHWKRFVEECEDKPET